MVKRRDHPCFPLKFLEDSRFARYGYREKLDGNDTAQSSVACPVHLSPVVRMHQRENLVKTELARLRKRHEWAAL
jgi:hypothetical protein